MEIWKDIPNFYGIYQVSNLGNVKSLNRKVNHLTSGSLTLKGKIIKPYITRGGYLIVNLYKESKPNKFSIHRLVGIAFLKNKFNKDDINHINGIKTDNRVENLEWCTRSENLYHAYNLDLKDRGEKHYNSKLTEYQVIEIRNTIGISQEKIASIYNVDRKCISKIINRLTWKHI